MHSGDAYYPFERVRELGRFFPKLKKQIKAARRNNLALKRSSYDDYVMTALLTIFQMNPSPEPEAL